MAWEWSHAPEAYDDARTNLENQDHEFLAVCLAEWQGSRRNGFDWNLSNRYDKSLAWAQAQTNETLAELIWDRMSSEDGGRTCDNGGFDAWACPYGCHTVSFTCEETEED